MIAVVDESTPNWPAGGVLYALAAVLVPGDEADDVTARLVATLNRSRPLHWESDKGSVVRSRIVAEMCGTTLQICVAATTCRSNQQSATRRRLLREHLLPMAVRCGVTSFVIESRTASDDNDDVREIRNWYRETAFGCPSMTHVSKAAPLPWLADAASGIWSDVLLNRATGPWLADLAAAGRLCQATWET